MPTNRIYVPHINPVKFCKVDPGQLPQYLSRHMDDWQFSNTIRDFEQPATFFQPWMQDDSVRLQFISNFQPLTLELVDCHGHHVYEQPFENMQQHFKLAGYYIRQSELDWASLGIDDGLYYMKIPELDWVSEPLDVRETHDNTLYIEYRTAANYYEGVIFGSPIVMNIRILAILKYKQPGSIDTVYADQNEAETMLHSVPFRIWRLITGPMPPWMIDKIGRIFGVDDLKIDGRQYTKAEGAAWEETGLEDYPMSGWGIDLRELLNRSSLVFDANVNIPGKAAMMSVIDKKHFGIEDNGGDFLEIVDGN